MSRRGYTTPYEDRPAPKPDEDETTVARREWEALLEKFMHQAVRTGMAENHAFFTRLMDEGGAMLWGRVTYEMMESYWPAVARGDEEAPPAMREWAVKLEAKPKYVVSSTRKNFPWTNSHHIAGDLRTGVQKLKDATPAGVLLGSGKLATELDRLDLIDEYKFLVHPRIAGHGPTLYQSGLPSTRRLELVSAKPLRSGAVAMHYRRAR